MMHKRFFQISESPLTVEVTLQAKLRDLPTKALPMLDGLGEDVHLCVESYLAFLTNRHTKRAYRRVVYRFLKYIETHRLSFASLAQAELINFLDEMPGSPASHALAISALRGLFLILEIAQIVSHDPTEGISCPKSSDPRRAVAASPSIDAVRRLLGAIGSTRVIDLRDRVIILLLTHGLTVEALIRLDLPDFRRECENGGAFLRIRDHEVSLSPATANAIDVYLRAAGLAGQGALLRTIQGKTSLMAGRMARNDVGRVVKKRGLAAAYPISVRTLRATALV